MAKIGHINLSVSDMERSVVFYDRLMFTLGFEKGLDESGDWGAVKGYKGENIELEIIHENSIEYKEFNRYVGVNHIAFEVESKEKVDELYKLVKTLGVKITRKPKNYPEYTEKYYAFFFRDPDGIPLEIAFI
jgi:catechol 2,3-dioxygenase-like lactoylglutathione lyase family enzyme